MASDKQISANQRNSLKSTGPISEAGKAIVAQNAMKHGILTSRVSIDEDEKEDFYTFASHLRTSLMPTNPLEELLIDRIISNIWRLRRVIHIETLLLKSSIRNDWETYTYQNIFEGGSGQAMATLSRYERSLEHGLFRTLKELREIKGKPDINVAACLSE